MRVNKFFLPHREEKLYQIEIFFSDEEMDRINEILDMHEISTGDKYHAINGSLEIGFQSDIEREEFITFFALSV